MNKKRLLMLADALETRIPAYKFNLDQWRLGGEDHSTSRVYDAELLHDCNTTGCAVGWACALPEFQAEGLIWDPTEGWPAFENRANWSAVEAFFEFSAIEAHYLFDLTHYVSEDRTDPLAVARRIRQFVEDAS